MKTNDKHGFTTEDTESTEKDKTDNELTKAIIGCAIEVHRRLGPGLLESIYEECLVIEMGLRGVPFERQKLLEIEYRLRRSLNPLRIDLLVGGRIVVEFKSVDRLIPIHEAQLLTYLRLTNCRIGLLINFNVKTLKEGIRRRIHDGASPSSVSSVVNPVVVG